MKDEILMPCTEWAEKLAARHPEDISPSNRIALNDHIASCEACAAVYAAYHAMEINIRALPTTSLPGLPYERLRQRDRSVMFPLFSLLAYFGLIARGEPRMLVLPLKKSVYIKQSLFRLAIVACLVLTVIVGVIGLGVPPRPIVSVSSPVISSTPASIDESDSISSASPRILYIDTLTLTLFRLCSDSPYPDDLHRIDTIQRQRYGKNPACSMLQTEGI